MAAPENRCVECGRPTVLTREVNAHPVWMCGNCIDATFSVDRFGEFLHAFLVPGSRKGQCPYCGTTDAQAKKSGLVGCPVCYLALSDDAVANPYDALDSDA